MDETDKAAPNPLWEGRRREDELHDARRVVTNLIEDGADLGGDEFGEAVDALRSASEANRQWQEKHAVAAAA